MKEKEVKIESLPFSWNNNMSEEAIEDFHSIRDQLSYCVCQSIGMALAKLKLLEEQGCMVDEDEDTTT